MSSWPRIRPLLSVMVTVTSIGPGEIPSTWSLRPYRAKASAACFTGVPAGTSRMPPSCQRPRTGIIAASLTGTHPPRWRDTGLRLGGRLETGARLLVTRHFAHRKARASDRVKRPVTAPAKTPAVPGVLADRSPRTPGTAGVQPVRVCGRHTERNNHPLVMRGSHHTGVHGGSANKHKTRHRRQHPPHHSAGLCLTTNLDKRRSGGDLTRQLLLTARRGGGLQHAR